MDTVIHSVPTKKGKVTVTERKTTDAVQYIIAGPFDNTPAVVFTQFPKQYAIDLANVRAKTHIGYGN